MFSTHVKILIDGRSYSANDHTFTGEVIEELKEEKDEFPLNWSTGEIPNVGDSILSADTPKTSFEHSYQ